MYITLTWVYADPDTGDPTYESGNYQIKNLSFSPQVDMTGNSLPVNEYSCDVILPEPLPGDLAAAELYDAMDRLWSAYPLSEVVKITDKCIRVTASSWIKRLEGRQLEARMYAGETAEAAIEECFGTAWANAYTVNSSIASKTVTGYAPAQSARDRLTSLLFVLGAVAIDVYRSDVLIRAVDRTETTIPLEHTYMRPLVTEGEWVTALRVTTYSFTEGTPQATDAYVSAGSVDYIVSSQTFELTNPNAPDDARENVLPVDGLMLIHSGNVSQVAARLAEYWFNPAEAQLTCINNRSYKPGDRVTGYAATDRLISGYIRQADFRFGKQSASALKLVGVANIEGAKLTINYRHGARNLGRETYYLPVGVAFSISNPYLDQMRNGHRIIYRPTTENAEGTMVAGGLTVTVNYEIALDLYEGVLHVISVDEITEQSSGGEYIGVIS